MDDQQNCVFNTILVYGIPASYGAKRKLPSQFLSTIMGTEAKQQKTK